MWARTIPFCGSAIDSSARTRSLAPRRRCSGGVYEPKKSRIIAFASGGPGLQTDQLPTDTDREPKRQERAAPALQIDHARDLGGSSLVPASVPEGSGAQPFRQLPLRSQEARLLVQRLTWTADSGDAPILEIHPI
jgi:hypothetical protein